MAEEFAYGVGAAPGDPNVVTLFVGESYISLSHDDVRGLILALERRIGIERDEPRRPEEIQAYHDINVVLGKDGK